MSWLQPEQNYAYMHTWSLRHGSTQPMKLRRNPLTATRIEVHHSSQEQRAVDHSKSAWAGVLRLAYT